MLALFAFSVAHALEPDLDGDGYTQTFDCDDLDAAVNPDASETCDDIEGRRPRYRGHADMANL